MLSFCKEERLCSKKVISQLLNNGASFFSYPFTVKWIESDSSQCYPVQILTVVPKRNFKKAVDRNRIKRLIKEAYRINKELLFDRLNNKNKKLALMLIYSGKKIISYEEITLKINIIIEQLTQSI